MKSRWKLLGAVEDCFVERSEKVSATQTSSWNTIYNFIYKFLHRAGLFSYSDCEWFSAPMMTQSRSKLKTCPSRMSWVSLMSMGSSDMIFPLKVKSPSKGLNTLFFSSVNAPACKQNHPQCVTLTLTPNKQRPHLLEHENGSFEVFGFRSIEGSTQNGGWRSQV